MYYTILDRILIITNMLIISLLQSLSSVPYSFFFSARICSVSFVVGAAV